MKSKYFSKLVFPLSVFCAVFRILELVFSVEYVSGSYFYKNDSLIPVFFDIFICVCLIFFLSFSVIAFFKQKNIKSQQKKETQSKLNLIKKTTISEYILYSVSAVCLLIFGLQLFFNNVLNKDYKTLISTFTPYIIIFCLLSIVFIIKFASSPQKTSSNKIISILSFSPIIFYILIIFDKFIACQGIINTVFLTFEFSLLCSLMLTLLSIPKLYLEDKVKYRFLSLSMCSVILSVVKLTDAILYLLNSLNADKIFKLISHLNYIDCNVYLDFANFFLSIGLFLTATRLFKKIKKDE